MRWYPYQVATVFENQTFLDQWSFGVSFQGPPNERGMGMEGSQRRMIPLSFNVETLFITKCAEVLYFSNF